MRDDLTTQLVSQGWLLSKFSDFNMITYAQGAFQLGLSVGVDSGIAFYAGGVQDGQLDQAWFVEMSATTPDDVVMAIIGTAMEERK